VCVVVREIIFFLYIDIGRMKRGWLGWIEQVFLHKRSLFVVLCIASQKAWKLKSRVFKSLNRYGTQKRKRRGAGKEGGALVSEGISQMSSALVRCVHVCMVTVHSCSVYTHTHSRARAHTHTYF